MLLRKHKPFQTDFLDWCRVVRRTGYLIHRKLVFLSGSENITGVCMNGGDDTGDIADDDDGDKEDEGGAGFWVEQIFMVNYNGLGDLVAGGGSEMS